MISHSDINLGDVNISMDLSLEEFSSDVDPVVDLNKSFYFDDDLEMDLKQAEDPRMEDAHLDLRSLSLDHSSTTSSSDSSLNSTSSFFSSDSKIFSSDSKIFSSPSKIFSSPSAPGFATEKLLSEAVDTVFSNNLMKNVRIKEKKNRKSLIPIASWRKNKTNENGETAKKSCQSCLKYFPKKYLSRHLFLSSCGSLYLNKTARNI